MLLTIGATTYRIVYNKSCYTTDTIYLGDKHIMNNQQTQFSVRVSKEDFLVKAKEAYDHYYVNTEVRSESLLNVEKQILSLCKTSYNVKRSLDLFKRITRHTSNIDNFKKAQRVLCVVGMVSISPDEFVTVTEDTYNLIYKCDS